MDADIVCLDLEDSVPPDQKIDARQMVRDAIGSGWHHPRIFVRVNSPESGMIADDLRAVAGGGLDGIVVPKVNRPDDLQFLFEILKELEPPGSTVEVIPSVESAAGVINAYNIATCDPRVGALVFGIFDLLNDMGIEYTPQAACSYGRAKVPLDAAAAGIPSIDGIWQDIRDTSGFEADCHLGRTMGYSGKSLIHPAQIPTTHREFAPTPSEIRWARRVCEAYPEAVGSGRGAILLEGKMIDEVHYKRAKSVLDFADKTN